MKLIIGLGNPGKEYAHTKHNVGFDVLENYARKFNINFKLEKKFMGEIYTSKDLILLKPTTYMNLSGNSLALVMNFYKLSPEDIIVIYDDLDLSVGKIRYRLNGSSGGHNGIKDIISKIGTEFKRIKIGIGRNDSSVKVQVLSPFSKEERVIVDESIEKVTLALEDYINGIKFEDLGSRHA